MKTVNVTLEPFLKEETHTVVDVEALKRWLGYYGISQGELAEEIGVTHGMVSSALCGRKLFGPDIAKALDKAMSSLIRRKK